MCNYRGFGDLVAIASLQNGSYQTLNAADLTDYHLVVVVVASEVGQDAGGARHHVDVFGPQQTNNGL